MKKLIAFLIVAMGLGTYIYFFDNSQLDFSAQKEEQNQLLYDTFQEKNVHHIIIKNGEETIDLTRPWLGAWTLNNVNYPADREAINQMLELVLTITKDHLVSNNPDNWDKFEVTPEKGIEVILKEREGREVAHFWVGKTGPSYGTQYFRKNNLKEVYLVNADLKAQLTKPIDVWRDRTILKLDVNQIRRVEVVDNYNLARSGSGWLLNDTEISPEKVSVVLNAVSDLQTTEFPTDAIDLTLDTAEVIVNVQVDSGTKSLYLKKSENSDDYFVILDGEKTLFKITKVKADEILRIENVAKTEEQ